MRAHLLRANIEYSAPISNPLSGERKKVRFNSAFHKIRASFYATESARRIGFIPNLKIGRLTLRLPRSIGSEWNLNIPCAWRDDRLTYNTNSTKGVSSYKIIKC